MNPIFTIQYGEFSVADKLTKSIKNSSIFVPSSNQEKGIDLLLYKYNGIKNAITTIQVKTSRTYEHDGVFASLFPRFEPQVNADWFILAAFYVSKPNVKSSRVSDLKWQKIYLAFTRDEMVAFMNRLHLKKDPSKPDTKFEFRFTDDNDIYQYRGNPSGSKTDNDMTKYILDKRIKEIEDSMK